MTMIEISEDAANSLLERIDEMQAEIHEVYLALDRNRLTQEALLAALTAAHGAHNVAA